MESDRTTSTPPNGLGSEGVHKARPLHGRTSGPTRRSTKGQWTPEEDEILRKAVQKYKGKNWKKIAECFKDRTDVQCLHRWQKVLNPELIKGPWSKEEDEIIIQLVNKYGPKKWSLIAQHLPGRIGKQCRERWHNHLNPAINKEAWTQEEELILIHAHQVYGNKWAELTKFLPGRSDNAIKNHWNSSVKKKLDTYLASGLLSQLPPLPMAPNQPTPSSSSKKQINGDSSGPKGAEAEEISEGSQESAFVAYSQSESEMSNPVLQVKEEVQLTEESCLGMEQSASDTTCARQFYSFEDVSFSVPEIPCQVGCSSKNTEQNFSNDGETSLEDFQCGLRQLSNISLLQLGLESSGFPMQCTDANGNQETVNFSFQTSVGLNSNSMEAIAMGPDRHGHMPISDEELCRVLLSDEMNSFASLSSDINMAGMGGSSDSLLCRSANVQNLEQYYCPLKSEALGTCHESFLPASSLSCNSDGARIYNVASDPLYGNQGDENPTTAHGDIINTNNSANSLYGGADSTSMQEQLDVISDNPNHLNRKPGEENATTANDGIINAEVFSNSHYDGADRSMQEQLDVIDDIPKLVPVNSFSSGSVKLETCRSEDEKPDSLIEQQDAGSLCYEPPRFPSLDIPIFSCDLIQPGCDMQQDFSPLGIRKLMSSMNCLSPFKLWDSPSRDTSPKDVLRSAAKTFKGTPSILKKRNRDLLSPLSDRRMDKKLEIDLTCNLAKEFSRLDVVFDENGSHKELKPHLPSNPKTILGPSREEEENLGHPMEVGQEKESALLSSKRLPEKSFDSYNAQEERKQGMVNDNAKSKVDIDADTAVCLVQEPTKVLVEHDVNDLQLFSPNKVSSRLDGALGPGTPKNQLCQRPQVSSEQNINHPETSSGPCLHAGSSPKISGKGCGSGSVLVKGKQTISSPTPLKIVVGNRGKDAGIESSNIFGETPFNRGIDSPSAWKSPWYFNSFLSGHRIGADTTMEDIGFLMSPGYRSYDAIGLIKQIGEQTAAAYAEAREVLGNDTPETLSKARCSHNQNVRLAEGRALDFSDCVTPAKGAGHGKSPSGNSSPSHLLKSCR